MAQQSSSSKTSTFKKTILIDDDEINNVVFTELGKKAQLTDELVVISHPMRAIDYIMQLDENEYPDVVFLDIKMPLINGWELIDEVRAYINPQKTKLFIFTSSQNDSDKAKAEAEPLVVDLITKPMTVKKMIALKEQYARAMSMQGA